LELLGAGISSGCAGFSFDGDGITPGGAGITSGGISDSDYHLKCMH